MQCSGDRPPWWVWVITGIEVKVGISLLGGAVVVLFEFPSFSVWETKPASNVIHHKLFALCFKELYQFISGNSEIYVENKKKT